MTNKLPYITYVIMISIFINQGDGRWKERDKESIRKDFMAHKKFKEKQHRHTDTWYDDYPKELARETLDIGYVNDFAIPDTEYFTKDINENVFSERIPSKSSKNVSHKAKIGSIHKFNLDKKHSKRSKSDDLPKKLNRAFDVLVNGLESTTKSTKEYRIPSSPNIGWPKFEDLLRSSGRQYDWKNDRWIKMKRKYEQVTSVEDNDNTIQYYVKHEFKYKILKSNNTNKRNVVVVTAVR